MGRRPLLCDQHLDGVDLLDRRHDQERRYLEGLADERRRRRKERDRDVDLDLEGLGKPDTEAGQEAKDSIDKLSTDLQAEVKTIQDELDGASGIAGLVAAAPAIATALGTMGTDVTSTVTTLQGLDAKGELESAFKDTPSCSDLTGSK